MSNGQTNPPVVVPATHYQIPKEWLPFITLAVTIFGFFAVKQGWLTPAQVDTIKTTVIPALVGNEQATVGQAVVKPTQSPKLVPPKPTVGDASSFNFDDVIAFIQSDSGKQAIQLLKDLLGPKPTPAPVTPVTPLTPTVAPLTPAEIQALIEQGIQQGIDKWKQAQPTPAPTPIIVQPVVPVQGPKILLTDSQDKPLVGNTVDAGVLFQVSTDIPTQSAGWTTSRHGNVSVVTLKGNAGFACSLNADPAHRSEPAWVEFFLTNFDTRATTSARIDCNQAPQPPPTPVTPVVNPVVPDQQKPAPVKRRLFLSVVEDPLNRTADTAIVLSAIKVWNGFRTDGDDWRFYDNRTTEEKGKRAVLAAGAILPALVIHDLSTGELLTSIALPKTIDGVSLLVKQFRM